MCEHCVEQMPLCKGCTVREGHKLCSDLTPWRCMGLSGGEECTDVVMPRRWCCSGCWPTDSLCCRAGTGPTASSPSDTLLSLHTALPVLLAANLCLGVAGISRAKAAAGRQLWQPWGSLGDTFSAALITVLEKTEAFAV